MEDFPLEVWRGIVHFDMHGTFRYGLSVLPVILQIYTRKMIMLRIFGFIAYPKFIRKKIFLL